MNVIIAPHPDDEVFLTGFILCHGPESFQVVVVSDGGKGFSKSRPEVVGSDLVEWRESETRAFCRRLGVAEPVFFYLPDGKVRLVDVIEKLANLFWSYGKVGKVFAPHPSELHPDHKIVSSAVRTVFGSASGSIFGFFSDPVMSERCSEGTPPTEEIELLEWAEKVKKECFSIYESQDHFLPSRYSKIERVWKL